MRPAPRLLLRYLTSQIGTAVTLGLGGLGVFLVAADLMGNLSGEFRDGVPFRVILQLQLLKIPDLLVQVAWAAMLAALLYVLGQMARHREYIAALAGGVSVYQLSLPALFVATLVAAAVFGVQEAIVPAARDAMVTLRGIYAREGAVDLRGTIHDISYYAADSRSYVIGTLDVEAGVAQDILMDRVVENQVVEQLRAERGTWDDSRQRWVWSGLVRRTFDAQQHITQQERYAELVGDLRASPRELRIEKRMSVGKYNLSYMSLGQLRRRMAALTTSAGAPTRLAVVYYAKWSEPVSTIVVAFLAIPGALSIERRGLVRGAVVCVVACVAFFALRQVGLAMGRGGILPPMVAAWGPHGLATAFGMTWLYRTPT